MKIRVRWYRRDELGGTARLIFEDPGRPVLMREVILRTDEWEALKRVLCAGGVQEAIIIDDLQPGEERGDSIEVLRFARDALVIEELVR